MQKKTILNSFKTTKRRIFLATVSVVCLLMGMSNANAQFSGGNGTSTSPYIITTAQELAQLAVYVNAGNTSYNDKYYKLGNNINLATYSNWTPIGYLSYRFKGNFDGDHHTVSNLKITDGSAVYYYLGLFGSVENGTIKNLGVINTNIVVSCPPTSTISSISAGGVVGQAVITTVLNCYSTGAISSSSSSSPSSSSMSLSSSYTGGVVGYADSTIVWNCYSTCTVSSSSFSSSGTSSMSLSYAGGVVGTGVKNTTVSNCYSAGAVSSSSATSSTTSYTVVSSSSGIAGNKNTVNCAALNPRLTCTGQFEHFGRVSSTSNNPLLSDNIGFKEMINPSNTTVWNNVGATNLDGADITREAIYADGTLGGKFTSANGWVTENGKLPGFGEPVEMPEHLVLKLPPTITTTNLPNGKVGTAYSQTLTAIGIMPITWLLVGGNLPQGLTLLGNGTILGTPTAEGVFTFTVKATNSLGNDTKEVSVTIENTPLITSTNLPNGKIGIEYNHTLTATGTAISWSLENGNLPTGLNLLENGTIIGKPLTKGAFNFIVKAQNNVGIDTKGFAIVIEEGNGVSEHSEIEIKIYPNPTNHTLFIDIEEFTPATITFSDMIGKEVFSQYVTGKTEINISHLAKGVYNVKILSEGKIVGSSKVVKQ